MVYFMLYYPSTITSDSFLHLLSFYIYPFYIDRGRSLDITDKTGKTQTSFLIYICKWSFCCYYWIYHENDRICLVIFLFRYTNHDHSFIDTCLWCRQSYAFVFWVFYIGEHRFTQYSVHMYFMSFYRCGRCPKDRIILSYLDGDSHIA